MKTESQTSSDRNLRLIFFFSFFLAITSALLIQYLANLRGESFSDVFSLLRESLFRGGFNYFLAPRIASMNFPPCYYLIQLLFCALFVCTVAILRHHRKFHFPHSVNQTCFMVALAGLLVFSSFQQIARNHSLARNQYFYADKNIHSVYSSFFGRPYLFSQTILQMLPTRHQGRLITDYDLSRDPGMSLQRRLSFFLYPAVSIRYISNAPEDALVLVSEDSIPEEIPPGYRVVLTTKDQKYRLLMKNKAHE